MRNMNGKNGNIITIDKNIQGGVPCIAGTRIPAKNIVYLIEVKKLTPEVIATKYYPQLTTSQIHEVLEWIKSKYGKLVI